MQYLLMSVLLIASLAFSCGGAEEPAQEEQAPVSANPAATPEPTDVSPVGDSDDATTPTTVDAEDPMETPVDEPEDPSKLNTSPADKLNTDSDKLNSGSKKKLSTKVEPTSQPAPNSSGEPFPDEENQEANLDEVVRDQARPRTVSLPSKEQPKVMDAKPAFVLSHDAFDALLRSHVSSSGKVDYNGFKKDKKALDTYLNLLQNNPPVKGWSKNKEMAYWINLYNAFTIQTIVNNSPVKSIMDIDGGKVWDKRTIKIGGKSLTLNDIEKVKLLKRFGDGRVHFAVNCAASSCPPLLNKAWTEDNLQRYLARQTKAFINNSKYNTLSASKIEVSQIFNWYASDFGGAENIVSYFQKYADTDIKDKAKVSFKEYNWSLNN